MRKLNERLRTKYVYSFGDGSADGDRHMKRLLGGKGAGLAEMSRIGLPVPPGFTLSTEVCALFHRAHGLPPELEAEIASALEQLEARAGKRLGDASDPLLVSVRSGAEVSMPGMMDTILNLGLNDATVEGLATRTGNRRFAFDAYRRFILMLGSIALGIDRAAFDEAFEELKTRHRFTTDVDVTAHALEHEVVPRFKALFAERTGMPFPQDVRKQLGLARDAVFRSWHNPRAKEYRRQFGIPDDLGTAVNVQAMVFGNRGNTSATGVGFTRDPGTGEKTFYGEFLPNAQGEDVVAGIRTPRPIAELQRWMPQAYDELREITARLEKHYRWPQDFEFTVEEERLYLLQTRNAKCTAFAAIRWASELLDEGLLSERDAVRKVDPQALDQLLHPVFDPKARKGFKPVCKGLPAGPGAATGKVVFTADDAVKWARRGDAVVLVRKETCPDDVHGMIAARGILTATGGMTSHAAVVGRQLGKPCVVGCSVLQVDEHARTVTVNGQTLHEGEDLSIDGSTGEVIFARVPTTDSEVVRVLAGKLPAPDSRVFYFFNRLMRLADKFRTLRVRANADQPSDARLAFAFGAEGIGLCRTEHMFFAEERLPQVVRMILSARKGREGLEKLAKAEAAYAQSGGDPKTLKGGSRHLAKELAALREEYGQAIDAYEGALGELLKHQRKDFHGLFKAMRGNPVTIRTLDPPLHEFLPSREALTRAILELQAGKKLSHERRKEIDQLLERGDGVVRGTRVQRLTRLLEAVDALHEFNPMMGHRGCRLGISYPEITRMQARALFEAAARCVKDGEPVKLEIMVPLVGTVNELSRQKELVVQVARQVMEEKGVELPYQVGVMIEVPRAALTANEIAREAEFFSFGTNDLTQLTFGFSRDDATRFLHRYVEERVLPRDPFVSLDRNGVGELMRLAAERGRQTRPDLKLGICGEHGGDPASVSLCQSLGLSYVSCSPFRVPIARLAAAQAALEAERAEKANAGGAPGMAPGADRSAG